MFKVASVPDGRRGSSESANSPNVAHGGAVQPQPAKCCSLATRERKKGRILYSATFKRSHCRPGPVLTRARTDNGLWVEPLIRLYAFAGRWSAHEAVQDYFANRKLAGRIFPGGKDYSGEFYLFRDRFLVGDLGGVSIGSNCSEDAHLFTES